MEFDVLKDLVKIITRNKVKQIEVLGNPILDEGSSRLEEFYVGLDKNKFDSDDEAARYFFKSDEKDPNYRKLRNRLIRQLINTSFFIDVQQPMFNDRAKAWYHCQRDYTAASLLKTRDAHKASIYLLLQALEQATKFEFTDLAADICRQLRIAYARNPGDQENHEKFSHLHRLYEEKRYWEMKALDYHENLIHHYIGGRSANEDVHNMACRYFDELKPKLLEVDTMLYYTYTYTLGVIQYTSVNDSKNAMAICDEALQALQTRKNPGRGALVIFAMNKLACMAHLRIFEPDSATANYCLSLAEDGDFNWFKIMDSLFYYHTYNHKYQEALKVYETVTGHSRFHLLSGGARDIWKICGGYLHLLAGLGQLDKAEVEAVVGFYDPGKPRYKDEYEVLDREKGGMNIPLILLPIMFSIVNNTYEEDFGRSLEALEKYRRRHLDNEVNRRSALFLKMLLALAEKDFEGDRAERKMEKEWKQLQQIPSQMAGQSFMVEIVPYEDLWELLTQFKK